MVVALRKERRRELLEKKREVTKDGQSRSTFSSVSCDGPQCYCHRNSRLQLNDPIAGALDRANSLATGLPLACLLTPSFPIAPPMSRAP